MAMPILVTVVLGAMVSTDRLSPILAMVISVVVLAGTLIVLNKSDDTAWLFDGATGEKRAEVPTGGAPHEVAVSPDGALAVVTDYGAETPGNTLTVSTNLQNH